MPRFAREQGGETHVGVLLKLIALLSDRDVDLAFAAPHLVCCADPTDAILAELQGAQARPQRQAGVVFAWPRDAAECSDAESALAPHSTEIHRMREVLHWDELGLRRERAVVLTYLVRRRADLSFADFMAHYRERHAPLARIHHPGIARYAQNFALPGANPAPIDAISELWFRSEDDARTRFYRDEESRRAIGEDVRRFIDLRGGSAFAARPIAG
jgi:uncharacterized protein (TIGR02118 family)